MTKQYLIGFSGPPRSGKDSIATTLAAIIENKHGFQPQLLACSTPMREVVYAMLWLEYSEAHYDAHKDIPQEALGGRTIRQAMIALSEEHVKPSYGHKFWGQSLLARRWDPIPRVLIVTDCGFPAEVELFTEVYGFDNVAYPQIQRMHTTFEGDSRSYVGTPDRITAIINDDDVPTAANRLYGRLVNQFHWDLS
jgi:hypothetical protein